MRESKTCSSSSTNTGSTVPFKILSKPSDVIKAFNRIISVGNLRYDMTLVTMRRSFLLVVNRQTKDIPEALYSRQDESTMSSEMLIQSFMNEDSSLEGLSLAIGEHSTCLIPSDHALASMSLASRLSKTLNNNGPVYVARMQAPDDPIIQLDSATDLYEKIFQFVRDNYKKSQTTGNKVD